MGPQKLIKNPLDDWTLRCLCNAPTKFKKTLFNSTWHLAYGKVNPDWLKTYFENAESTSLHKLQLPRSVDKDTD